MARLSQKRNAHRLQRGIDGGWLHGRKDNLFSDTDKNHSLWDHKRKRRCYKWGRFLRGFSFFAALRHSSTVASGHSFPSARRKTIVHVSPKTIKTTKAGRERVWEQQSYITNRSSMGSTRGELLGFCKSQNDALLSLTLSLSRAFSLSVSLSYTHTHTMQQMSHTLPSMCSMCSIQKKPLLCVHPLAV